MALAVIPCPVPVNLSSPNIPQPQKQSLVQGLCCADAVACQNPPASDITGGWGWRLALHTHWAACVHLVAPGAGSPAPAPGAVAAAAAQAGAAHTGFQWWIGLIIGLLALLAAAAAALAAFFLLRKRRQRRRLDADKVAASPPRVRSVPLQADVLDSTTLVWWQVRGAREMSWVTDDEHHCLRSCTWRCPSPGDPFPVMQEYAGAGINGHGQKPWGSMNDLVSLLLSDNRRGF